MKYLEKGEKIEYTEEQLTPQTFLSNPFENSGFYEVDKENEGSMYYVFFRSQDQNDNAPIIIWLQGGPGCSSLGGLFSEMGPYYVNKETLKLEKNKYTWNEKNHMLFIDNPVGAGFSFVKNDEGYVTNQDQVADNLYLFLIQFFNDNKDLINNDLYIFGESYAGKYVPAIAHKIVEGKFYFNLKGIGIGDGLTDPLNQFGIYHDFAYGTQLIDIHDMKKVLLYENKTIEAISLKDWKAAVDLWNNMFDIIETAAGNVNVYDYTKHEPYDFEYISKYLNLESTKKLMHTEGHKYQFCDSKTYEALEYDIPKSIVDKLIEILHSKRRVKVMLYNGQLDLIIPTTSTIYGWIYNMNWKYKYQYQAELRNLWKEDGELAGYFKNYENLYTVIVSDAGHMSPMDQPKFTQRLVQRFIEENWN